MAPLALAPTLGLLLLLCSLFLPAHLLAAQPASPFNACNASAFALDPTARQRSGDDYQSLQLPSSSSSIAACMAACCADRPRCQAISFNNPQPMGIVNCSAGSVCCMLKEGVPPLIPNQWPGQVQTAAVLAPGPDPPLAHSQLITDVTFEFSNGSIPFWSGKGDTWPSTWAANNLTYAWACDRPNNASTDFSPMSLFQIQVQSQDQDGGDEQHPISPSTPSLAVEEVAFDPIDYNTLCAAFGPTGRGLVNVKPSSIIALNSTLYSGISCINYGDDAQFNRQHNLAGFLARSDDWGLSWRNVTPVGAFPGRFAAPMFVSCGQNNSPCRRRFGGLLYVFFQGAFNDASYWDNNDALFLARVPEDQLENLAAYEYSAGKDLWVADSSQAQPVFVFGRMLGENAVSFHPGLNRFLIANYGFLDTSGNPRPWHQQPLMSPHRTQLLLLEAEQPWGPFRVFYRSDNAAPGGLYTPTFPSALMQPVTGTSASVTLFFSCLDGAPDCRYTLNYQTLTLHLNASANAMSERAPQSTVDRDV